MSRAVLLYGEKSLLNEYNERVVQKLNIKSAEKSGKSAETVGFVRGMKQMLHDVWNYQPWKSCLGKHFKLGGLLDAKREFYRFISLVLSDLGQIFNIRCPSPWQVISELQTAGIISQSVSASTKVCLSIANEIRLKTYFANNGQKELFSPVSNDGNDVDPFRDFGEDAIIRLLSTSDYMSERCMDFCVKYFRENQIDISIFQNLSARFLNAVSVGYLYYRLQNLPKALEWMESEPKDSPDYAKSLIGQGSIYSALGQVEKSVECYVNALQVHRNANDQNGDAASKLGIVESLNALANEQVDMGNYEAATAHFNEAISKYLEIIGKEAPAFILASLMQNLGYAYNVHGDMSLALETFKAVQEIHQELRDVPDDEVIHLNLNMAWLFSKLDIHEQSLEHIDRALQHCQKAFGENNLSIGLARTCNAAGVVYDRLNLGDKAECMFKRSLDIYQSVHGGGPHRGMFLYD